MFNDLIASLASPTAYRRFAGEKPVRCAAYVAVLSLIFVTALAVAIKIRLAPLFDETFDWLKTSMPSVTFSAGKVTSAALVATRVEHPRIKQVALMIDTNRTDPVTVQQLGEAKVLAYLTANAMYLSRDGRVEIFDLSKSADKTVTIDAGSYRDMEKAFNWVFYPLVLMIFFGLFCVSLSFFGLLYGLAGLLVASMTGADLTFSALFRMALHAQTAAVFLRAADALSPVRIPKGSLISLALSATTLILAIRAAGKPQAEPPAPAA